MPSRSSAEWAVACPVCPLQTPYFDTEAEAIAAWNTRLTAQSGEGRSGAGEDAILAHFTRMMEAAANYVEPTTYVARHPNVDALGACKYNTEFPEPEESHAEEAKQAIRQRRDQAFIRDMIYMLDGPEQRAAALNVRQSDEGEREALRIIKAWLDWYRFATGDDDCQYLNGKGWDDAEALASTSMGYLAALRATDDAGGV